MTPAQIVKLRKELGLSQIMFSIIMHVSFATVNRWEGGRFKPQDEHVIRMKRMQKRLRAYGKGSIR